MSYLPMLIPGFESGLVQSTDDTLIEDDACASLVNAYVWRKRLLKKGGYFLYGRLGRRQDDVAIAAPTLSYFPIEPGSMSYVEGLNTNVDTPTSATTGTIAGGTITYATGVCAGLPNPGVMSYNVVTDDFSPVMGLFERELESINEEENIAFDRRMAYVYNGVQFLHLKYYINGLNEIVWSGSSSDFFSEENYYGAFWATNNVPGLHGYAVTAPIVAAGATVIPIGANNFAVGDVIHISGVVGMTEINGLSGTVTVIGASITTDINSIGFTLYTSGGFVQAFTFSTDGDGIRWYAGAGWSNFAPPLSNDPKDPGATEYLQGCRFIKPFKERLVCFSTWEGSTYAGRRSYNNRVRWTARISTPYYANLVPPGYTSVPGVWYEQPGAGGSLDAPTEERIIGVEYLKDYILVLFERSSYILYYTGSRDLPFQFQKINSEFGCESPHSVIPFDDRVLSIGNRGIYQISTSGAERIDDDIPDIAFEMQNTIDGTLRVYGVRDFYSETVFWSYRSIDTFETGTFPNRILMYNYENDSWAIFKNSFTCFGEHITETTKVWDEIMEIWDDYDVIWDDAKHQTNNPITLAGNQQGHVFWLDLIGENSINGNQISLTIESITIADPAVFTCTNHNLEPEDVIYLSDLVGDVDVMALNNHIFRVGTVSYTANTFILETRTVNAEGVVIYVPVALAGTYYGAGKILVIDNFEIVTKSFNPFTESDRDVRFGRADFLLNTDDEAQILVQTYVDKTPYRSNNPTHSEVIVVEGEAVTKKWYTTYPQTFGKMVQLRLLFSDEFMFTKNVEFPVAKTGVDITMLRLWFSRQ